jgi:hypothetical protein
MQKHQLGGQYTPPEGICKEPKKIFFIFLFTQLNRIKSSAPAGA